MSFLSAFGARYYDPALGLFVSQDPAGQFFSPYSYGGGNPLAGTDPTGAEFSLLAVFIIALLSAVATVIDAAVQGASLGDALVAGVITFGTSVAGAYLGGIVGAAVQGLGPAYAPALQVGLAAVAVGSVAYGAYESFSNGRYASGAAIFLSIGIGYALSGRGETPPAADQTRGADGALPETGVCSGSCGGQGARDHEFYLGARFTDADARAGKSGIGHGYVGLRKPGEEIETFGLYPAEGTEFGGLKALRNVEGTVVPGRDLRYLEKALAGEQGHSVVRYAITKEQYLQAVDAINSYQGRSYNAVLCNCTHFAIDVAKAAGVPVPFAGIIKRPEVLQPALQRFGAN